MSQPPRGHEDERPHGDPQRSHLVNATASNPVCELFPTDDPITDAETEAVARTTAVNGPDRGEWVGVLQIANASHIATWNAQHAALFLQALRSRLEFATGRKFTSLEDDAFCIFFDEETPAETVEAELDALAYILAQDVTERRCTLAPDVRIGVARAGFPEEPVLNICRRARDAACPRAQFGRDGASRALDRARENVRRFSLDQALRRAVREGQLSLCYQPQVNIETGQIAGAETLLRWNSPTLGEVSPGVFVPLLEASDLVHEIGLWALNTACRQITLWRRAGHPQLRLAVNVSAVQLRNPELTNVILQTISSHNLKPQDIELELTETAAMEDQARNSAILRELGAMGFGIALDDFGVGYSNLINLQSLPVTKIKIDRAFVSSIDELQGGQSICRAIIRLCDELGVQVLAEGVERPEEVRTLRRLGCKLFQGYFFSRPRPADALDSKLARPEWLAEILSDLDRNATTHLWRTTA